MDFMSYLPPLAVGFGAGILSSFGLGGGTLLLVWLTSVSGMDPAQARGINLLYFLPVSAAALPSHIKRGYLKGKGLFLAIFGGLAGVMVSTLTLSDLLGQWQDKAFGVFLLVMGILEWCSPGRKKP
ncbi:MAG: sulfite exporter TauE/SafE family protein [Oscillospiraceae bacterium]|nr:sulfite exporter TauE/SafE family protein [Oscillospiraceae bacterium]